MCQIPDNMPSTELGAKKLGKCPRDKSATQPSSTVCVPEFTCHSRSYSAQTAAFAYSHVDPSAVTRFFVLGPSHHVHIR